MSYLAIILLALFGLYVVVGLLVFLWGTRRCSPERRSRLLTRVSDRKILFKDSPFNVRLYARGMKKTRPTEQKTYHVVLVIDRSESMGGSAPGSRLAKAKEACIKFVNMVDLKTCRVGVVCYDDEVETCCDITDKKHALVNGITKIRGGGATDIGFGLERAEQLLQASHREEAEEIIVLLSDGYPHNGRGVGDPEILQVGRQIIQKGIRIICIGIGEANTVLMEELASERPGSKGDKEYYNATDREDLMRFYESIAAGIEGPGGTRAMITEYINDQAFIIGNFSTVHMPESVKSQSWEIHWFLPFLQTTAQEVPYQLVPYRLGWHKISPKSADMVWHDMDQIKQPGVKSNDNPYALVLPAFAWWVWFVLLNPVFWILLSMFRGLKSGIEVKPPPERKEFQSLTVTPNELVKLEEKKEMQFRPTLAVGFGHTGRWVLTYFKKIVTDLNMGTFPADRIRLLCIDTGCAGDRSRIEWGGIGLSENEICALPSELYSFHKEIINTHPDYAGWYDRQTTESLNRETFNLSYGTNRFRHLGRLSYFKAMQENDNRGPASLEQAASFIEELLKEEGCQLFFTGSTVGGCSSGILLDTAIWFAGRFKEKEHITTYSFICGRSGFQMREDDGDIYNLNSLAFLREWERFIVNSDFPLSIQYPAGNVRLNRFALFDHNFLIDPARGGNESLSLYPMVADIMSQFAPQLNPLRNRFETEINPEAARQAIKTGKAGIINIGCRSIKLPVANILNYLRLRFIFELFSTEFNRLKMVNNLFVPSDGVLTTRTGLKELFVGRQLVSPCPPVFSAISELAELSSGIETDNIIRPWQKALAEAGMQAQGEPARFYLKKNMLLALRRIMEWALWILNGAAAEGEEERSGGIIRLMQHLAKLEDMLAAVPVNLQRIPIYSIAYEDQVCFEESRVDNLLDLIEAYKVVTESIHKQVRRWFFCLADGFPKDQQQGLPPGFKGMARRLFENLKAAENHLQKCLELETIKYVADKEFLDRLYNMHFAGLIEDGEYLNRFEWKVSETGFDQIEESFWSSDVSQVSELNLEGLLELAVHSDITRSFHNPVNNEELLDFILEMSGLDDKPQKYFEAFADIAAERYMTGFLSENAFIRGPGINAQGDFIERFVSSKAIEVQSSNSDAEKFDDLYPVPICRGRLSFETHIPITESLSYTKSLASFESGDDHKLPYLFEEEQKACMLEEFYKREIGRLDAQGRFSPRFVQYFGNMDRLQQFLYLFLTGKLLKRIPETEVDRCLAIKNNGTVYYLTQARDQLDLEKAMTSYVITRRDVFDSSKTIPEIDCSISDLVKAATDFVSGSNIPDEAIRIRDEFLNEVIMLLKIIMHAGGKAI